MSASARRIVFLPGASGNTHFWRPVADRIGAGERAVFQAYPGFGGVPARRDTNSFDDLLRLLLEQLADQTDLVAQSMGGVLALRAALARPDQVRRIVLTATSGGLDTHALGATDWRANFSTSFPGVPDWFARERADLTDRLRTLHQPVLLIWGDADPISPVAVGERLLSLLPNARLVVIPGGDHDVAHSHPEQVAAHLQHHLALRLE